MSDTTTAFFEGLGSREHEPLLERAKGKIRFDVLGGRKVDHWLVAIDCGDVVVTRGNADADCIVRTDRSTLDGIVTGRVNAFAAILRGLVQVDGDPQLLVLFRRAFPGPAGASGPNRPTATGAAR